MSKTILLIENEPSLIDIYTIAIKKNSNFKVKVMSFTDEVFKEIEKMKQGKAKMPDLILLSHQLHNGESLKIIDKIRKHKDTRFIPIFVLTDFTAKELASLDYDLDSEYFITKTQCGPIGLVDLIKKRLGRK